MTRRGKICCLFGGLALAALIYWGAMPRPQRVFLRYGAALQTTADAMLQRPPSGDVADPDLPEELSGSGVRRIKIYEKCVVFSLESWPIEPSTEIVYSAGGYKALPINEFEGPYNSLKELKRIDRSGHWFYWIRN